jgi:hypothetical protein
VVVAPFGFEPWGGGRSTIAYNRIIVRGQAIREDPVREGTIPTSRTRTNEIVRRERGAKRSGEPFRRRRGTTAKPRSPASAALGQCLSRG